MAEYEDSLHIGDYVCLFSSENSGFVFSELSGSQYNGLLVFNNQDVLCPKDIPDSQMITFEICPQNRYKLNKKYRLLKESYGKALMTGEESEALKDAKRSAETENEDNVAEERRLRGKLIRYGECIQLRHLFTNKFIQVDTSTTSLRDKNKLKVKMEIHNGKTAQFRIMPRYRIKAEGDIVRSGDEVVFESEKLNGQYLHVSDRCDIYSFVDCTWSELNLALESSDFAIIRKTFRNSETDGALIGGSIIQFRHKYLQANLIAEGIFGEPQFEDVHLRVRECDMFDSKSLYQSTRCFSYWQIEQATSVLHGDLLVWGQPIRIRHMSSRLYLCISNNVVVLTDNGTDPSTVFSLHPVVKQSGIVQDWSDARIQHMATNLWICSEGLIVYKRKKNSWDKGNLKQISAKSKIKYSDAFTMILVDPANVADYNYIIGLIPCLRNIIVQRQQNVQLNYTEFQKILLTLEELNAFVEKCSTPYHRKAQKLLRESTDYLYSDVAKVVIEMIKDKKSVIEKITNKQIISFIKLLKSTKDPLYLQLLHVLCVCKGAAITQKQTLICQKILKVKNVFFEYFVSDGKILIKRKRSTELLSNFSLRLDDYNYICNQLKLFEAFCMNRNHTCIDLLIEKGFINWDVYFLIIKDESIDPLIRSLFCSLVTNAYIEVGSNTSLIDCISNVFSNESLKEDLPNADEIALQSSKYLDKTKLATLGHLKEFIQEYSKNFKLVAKTHVRENYFAVKLFQLSHCLMKYGYYTNAEIKQLLTSEGRIIGVEEDQSTFQTVFNIKKMKKQVSFRPKLEKNLEVITDIYCQIMDTIAMIMELEEKKTLKKFVHFFKQIESGEVQSSLSALLGEDFEKIIKEDDSKRIRYTKLLMKEIGKMFDYTSIPFYAKLPKEMVNISKIGEPEMINKAFLTIRNYYEFPLHLFRDGIESQILITKETKEINNELQEHVPILRRLVRLQVYVEHIDDICSVLRKFAKDYLEPCDTTISNPVAQGMLINHGVVSLLMELLRKIQRSETMFGPKLVTVITCIMELLIKLTIENERCQELLFNHLDLLLIIRQKPELLASLLFHIFYQNYRLCWRISTNSINKLVEILSKYGEKYPLFAKILSILVSVDGVSIDEHIIRKNQILIMKYVMQFFPIGFRALELQAHDRRKILLREEGAQSLEYLLNLIQLLAFCAKGDEKYIKSFCENVLPLEEILTILNNYDIQISIKKPFIDFLTWVYIVPSVNEKQLFETVIAHNK
ncbi:DgyrCDS5955 [Dimorphilus gyrociliatus]|uniref:DgyrCDS5955 n=1 Tax=Dimorphilus gyrociliatus TaxID=2664684 RepID=A0A7I8VN50_9ANNE|nr:DgyrCDS5955 [Dimorphilus gyrociliatus]